MCTSIAMRGKNIIFGRNMDIDYNFGERAIIMPRNFPLKFKSAVPPEKHYSVIGTGAVFEGYPLFADGMNENGLCIAALKFTDNSFYSPKIEEGKINLAPYEIIPYLLGKCRNLCEVKTILSDINIINVPFNENLPLSPLHWHIADKNGSVTVEPMSDGVKIYENTADILTNNPPFPFHIQNIAQYKTLSPYFPEIKPEPFGLGFGGIGLPGDYSPASRFIRADFLLSHTKRHDVTQLFHILNSVAIPEGAVYTPDKKAHKTTYSCCFDGENLTYFYKTYDDLNIRSIKLSSDIFTETKLIEQGF